MRYWALKVISFMYMVFLLSVCYPQLSIRGEQNEAVGEPVVAGIAWSPEGSRLAIARGPAICSNILNDSRYSVAIIDVATGQQLNRLAIFSCQPQSVAWNPNSDIVATGSNDYGLLLWNSTTGQVEYTSQTFLWQGPSLLRWSPDGRSIAQQFGRRLEIFDIETLSTIKLDESRSRGAIASMAWSADGTQIATVSDTGTVFIIDPYTDEANFSFSLTPTGTVLSMDWDSRRERLAIGDSDGRLYVLDSTSGELLHILEGQQRSILDVKWHPSGNLLASASRDGTVRIWNVAELQPVKIINHEGDVFEVTWSPDGDELTFGGVGDSAETVAAQIIIVPSLTPTATVTSTETPTATTLSPYSPIERNPQHTH